MSFRMMAPVALTRARAKLREMQVDRDKEVTRLIALAECNFRLAVHPETDSWEAVTLLRESVKIDGANPKHAYHLGRLHFLRGEFEEAARWFRLACCLAPTSHRIWMHVAVLLRELNAVYYGDERYEPNTLLRRAESIAEAIQAGEDNISPDLLDFVPPQSLAAKEKEGRQDQKDRRETPKAKQPSDDMRPSAKVRRYLHARRCRWSGVEHLSIEQTLVGRATQANAKKLIPVLQELTEKSGSRSGSPAAVAILCVQWLIGGYPVETVRRLMGLLPEGMPSRELLEKVCQLWEAPVAQLPRLIGIAVEEGRLPPLVAALIHRERLLWQPVEFRSLGAYRAARQLVAEMRRSNGTPNEDQIATARELVTRLDRAREALDVAPPKPLKDEVPSPKQDHKSVDHARSLVLFEAFESAIAALGRFKDEGLRLIKEGLELSSAVLGTLDRHAQAVADRRAAAEFLLLLEQVTSSALQRFHQLIETLPTLSGLQLPTDYVTRCEEAVTRLQDIGNLGQFNKPLKRIDKRLADAAYRFPETPREPVAEWPALLAGLRTALPDESSLSAMSPSAMPLPASTLEQRFAKLESAALVLEEVRTAVSEFIRVTFEPEARREDDADLFSQAMSDREALDALLKDVAAAGTAGLERGDAIQQEATTVPASELPADFQNRTEETTNRFRNAINLGSLSKRIDRAAKTLPETATKLTRTPRPPAELLQQLAERLATALEVKPADIPSRDREGAGTSLNRDREGAVTSLSRDREGAGIARDEGPLPDGRGSSLHPVPPKPREQMSAIEQLEYALTLTEWWLNQLVATALKSFDSYPEWIRLLPAFESLCRRIKSQQADILFRLGRRGAARSIWNSLLCTNRLNADALKNIAICDTVEADIGRSLNSWREYLELLYHFAVMSREPQAYATLRSQFHRAFGNAYAPEFLSAKFDNDWKKSVDVTALIGFLSSPGRVRNFISHRLLEYLNSRFEFDSPSLVLGIKRVEAESRTDEAEKIMLAFVEESATQLPARVRAQFVSLARKTVGQTAEVCRNSRRLTLQETPNYAAEEVRQIQLLARLFDLKLKLVVAFSTHLNMVKNITSFNFLIELSRLDKIPLGISPGLFPLIANTMGMDAETLQDLTATLRGNVIGSLLKYLLADDEPAERPIRQRQYQLLIATVRDPEFATFARAVDMPVQMMPAQAVAALNQEQDEAALNYLRPWHDDYPAMASLAVILANRLIQRREFEEARRRLEQSRQALIYEPTRRGIHYLLVQILIREINPHLENEDYLAAFDIGLEMVQLDDFQAPLATQVVQLYVAVSQKQGHKHKPAEFDAALTGWLQRATQYSAEPETDEDRFPKLSLAAIAEVRKAYADAKSKVGKL